MSNTDQQRKESEMETVILKNGAREAISLVAIVMRILKHLADERPLALCGLVMKCRDQDYQFFGDNEKYLQALKLVGIDGSIHNSDRNVILSAVQGEGFDMTIRSPVKEVC